MSSVTKSPAAARKTKGRGRGPKPKSILKRQFQFTENGKTRRETLYVGQRKIEEVALINSHVNVLLEAKRFGGRIPECTWQWIRETESKEPAVIAKLQAVGLIDTTNNPTVADFVDAFISRKQATCKPGTIGLCKQAAGDLKLFFNGKRVSEVSQGDAKEFWHWLITHEHKHKRRGGRTVCGKLGENTARRRLGRAREIFNEAIDYEIIRRNPFAIKSLKVTGGVGKKTYVPEATILAVIDTLPSDKLEWKLLLAFGRFIGCRMPSEIRQLTWSDVNFEANTILLKSPKTEGQGKSERLVPIFPEVSSLLLAQSATADSLVADLGREAGDAAVYVFPKLRNHSNAATTAAKMVKAAGFASWPKFWNSLRASRETDLMDTEGLRKACAWIGNSPAVAMKHYALTRGQDFIDAGRQRPLVAGLVAGHEVEPQNLSCTPGKANVIGETRYCTDSPKTQQIAGEMQTELPRMDSNHE